MDADTALQAAREGGTVLCLDTPEGTAWGIDMFSFHTGPRFMGVKMVPPGVHVVHWSARNKAGDSAPRTSLLLSLERAQVCVWRWSGESESFEDISRSDEGERYALGVRGFAFDRQLGAYPFDQYQSWRLLTSHVSHHIVPQQKDSLSAFVFSEWHNSREDAKGMTPQQRTQQNHDTSHALISALRDKFDDQHTRFLGELQCAFALFVYGENFDALERWKAMVVLVCGSEQAVHTHAALFQDFIEVLMSQLKVIPDDFFVSPLVADNFLIPALKDLHAIVSGCGEPGLFASLAELELLMGKRFGQDIRPGLNHVVRSHKPEHRGGNRQAQQRAHGKEGEEEEQEEEQGGRKEAEERKGDDEVVAMFEELKRLALVDGDDDLPVVVDPREVEQALGCVE